MPPQTYPVSSWCMANSTWDDFRGLPFTEFSNDLSFVCTLSWLAKDKYAWGEKNDRSSGSRRKLLAWSCSKLYFESHPHEGKEITCSLIMSTYSTVTAGKESSRYTENNKWPFILLWKEQKKPHPNPCTFLIIKWGFIPDNFTYEIYWKHRKSSSSS